MKGRVEFERCGADGRERRGQESKRWVKKVQRDGSKMQK